MQPQPKPVQKKLGVIKNTGGSANSFIGSKFINLGIIGSGSYG
jgi:hypothetical protein